MKTRESFQVRPPRRGGLQTSNYIKSYREWVQAKVMEKYIDASKSAGLGKAKVARGMSQPTLWASLVADLDSTKSLSWRSSRSVPVLYQPKNKNSYTPRFLGSKIL